TPRRQGRFDVSGALTSSIGMTGIVLGLVEAGTEGWGRPLTVGSLVLGAALLGLFVLNESRVEEPILPLRLLAHATRSSANIARGLVYAGMYGSFFFLSQFMQDVQHYDPLRAGVAFLPWPAAVFLSSQLTSRVLVRRLSQRVVMISGIALGAFGLVIASMLHAGTPYPQILVSVVLIGSGMGMAFVTLTTASLTDVEPGDIGAASGLINVSQQLGAALGLAVLVTVFGVATGHVQLRPAPAGAGRTVLDQVHALVVRGLHDVFGLGVLIAVSAIVLVAAGVRRQPVEVGAADVDIGTEEADFDLMSERRVAEAG
ncbi:MAG: MFS transporter, partial [Acidimicrobiales bacterium]